MHSSFIRSTLCARKKPYLQPHAAFWRQELQGSPLYKEPSNMWTLQELQPKGALDAQIKSNQSLSFRELWMEDAHKRWRQREMMQQKGQEHNAQIAGADHYILTNVPAVHEVPWASYAKPPTPEPTWACIWPLQPDRAFECHLFGLQYTGLCVTYKDRGNEDSNEWNSLEALKDLLLPRRTGDIIWKQTKT